MTDNADTVNSADNLQNKRWLKAQKSLAGSTLSQSVAMGAIAGILLIGQAALMAWIVDKVMFSDWSLKQCQPYLLTMLALILSRSLFSRFSERLAFEGAARIKISLRDQLLRRLYQLGPCYINNERSAEISNCLHNGIDALEAYYARYLPAVAFSSLIPLAILVVVFPLDWKSGLIFLVTAPLIPFFMILIGSQAEQLNQQRWRALARMGNHFLDLIQGLTQLKLYNASRREIDTVAQVADQYRHSTLSVLKVAFLSSLALEFLATISIALIAVIIGFRLYWGEMNFGMGLMVLLLAPEFYQPFRNLGTQYHARMEGISAAEKMLEILNANVPDQPSASDTDKASNSNILHQVQSISLENVHYSYSPDRPAIQGININITSPGLYALVGESGAGKTTLVEMLLGFISPQKGHIKINQQPLQQLGVHLWRQQLAWIPQSPQLFSGSIIDNIRLGNTAADLDSVKRAAEKAGASTFIDAFPDGYNTQIGEQGTGLSGGQRQRIALARAFLRKSTVLILDEPTSHLDPESEHLIQQSLKLYAQEHIVIVVAQRLHTVRMAERIFMMSSGLLLESGNHQQLLAKNGHYARLIAGKRPE
ncbi:thiol reductant ABC exporter subunit CydD [Motiliproteus sp. MSK22-1]|uniref:thiol reductant ABC exporter subunit CydD n=1 Tax=Motiliproteus sp. MSK22-1 TaxID=1897630 RepID=UPI000976850D|nr:thiol reductant ABC exporter subunit CydD [Motiliproteus sp. MSK22-1]OMH38867.1 thiol reductant ABC exporter subunit CydD [Motiliproteus sp. MSK22-1]